MRRDRDGARATPRLAPRAPTPYQFEYIKRYYFYMYTIVVSVGLLVGVVFLPVLLAVCGYRSCKPEPITGALGGREDRIA